MAQAKTSGERGFTLLELMIALALTGVLSLVAYTSLSLSLRAMSHGQVAADRVQELRVSQTIVARSLSSAVRGSLDQARYFIGNASEMRFFTLVPLEAYNMGGVYHWRILAGQDESNQLVLAVEQTKNLNWARDPEGVEIRQILLGHLAAVRFTYGQGGEEFGSWDAEKAKSLPDWVRIYLTQEGHDPLVWFIRLQVSDYRNEPKNF
jgi:general secretion pathway protein J